MNREKYLKTLKNAKRELNVLIKFVESDDFDLESAINVDDAVEVVEVIWDASNVVGAGEDEGDYNAR